MIISHEHFDLLDKIILERVVFKPPFKGEYTMHDEACFFHVIKGQSRLYTPMNHLNVKSTDSLLMKCGSYLNNWFSNEDDKPNEAVLVHLYPDVLKMVYENQIPGILSDKKESNPFPAKVIPINEMISNYVESLLFYFDNPSIVTDELIKLKVKEIILLLVNSESSGRITSMLSDLFNPNQLKFKEVIHSHIFEDLSIQDLAILTGYSLSSFKRKFNTVFGTSPTRYIRNQRLEKAEKLLSTTDLRISDIAYDCGFNDLGYFSKTFNLAYNCSPSDYRKSLAQTP